MSKRIGKMQQYDYFSIQENENLSFPQDLNDLNPESKNREVNAQNTVDHLCEKWDGEYHQYIAVVDENGYTRAANKGWHTTSHLTVDDMEYVRNGTIVRTEAADNIKSNGGSMGWTDINNMGRGEANYVVSSPEGQYVMEFAPNSDIAGFRQRIWADRDKINKRLETAHLKCMEKYTKGEYATKDIAARDNNNRQMDAIHEYYKDVAPAYGIKYSFKPNNDALAGNRSHLVPDQKMKAAASRKPRKGGKGSRTEPMARFEHRETRKTYMQYRVGNEVRVSDGEKVYRGVDAQEQLNQCRRTNFVTRKQYRDWKAGQKRRRNKKNK